MVKFPRFGKQIAIEKKKKDEIREYFRKEIGGGSGTKIEKMVDEKYNNLKDHLTSVRLCFQAFCGKKPICEKVFSEPINDHRTDKSLKICQMSADCGSSLGGEMVFMFCEKVNKKDIKVIFYDEDSDDWQAEASFDPNKDVHHQYAIAFRTPKYKANTDQNVFVKLYRPSDKANSEPKPFRFLYDSAGDEPERKKKRTSAHIPRDSAHLPSDFVSSDIELPDDPFVDNVLHNLYPTPQHSGDETNSLSPHQDSEPECIVDFFRDRFENADPLGDFHLASEPIPDMPVAEMADVRTRDLFPEADEFFRVHTAEGQMADLTTQDLHPEEENRRSEDTQQSVNQSRATRDPSVLRFGIDIPTSTSFGISDLFFYILHWLFGSYAITIWRYSFGLFERDPFTQTWGLTEWSVETESETDRKGQFYAAIRERDFDSIVKLVKKLDKSVINELDHNFQTPLHICATENEERILRVLLENGGDPSIAGFNRRTCVHEAVSFGSIQALKVLLEFKSRTKLDTEAYDAAGAAPIHTAVELGFVDCVKLLLEAGADVNIANKLNRKTPLHLAVQYHKWDIVDLLLKQPFIDVKATDHTGNTPFSLGDADIPRHIRKSVERIINPNDRIELVHEAIKPNSNPKALETDEMSSELEEKLCEIMDTRGSWREIAEKVLGIDREKLDSIQSLYASSSPSKAVLSKLKDRKCACNKDELLNILKIAGLSDEATLFKSLCK